MRRTKRIWERRRVRVKMLKRPAMAMMAICCPLGEEGERRARGTRREMKVKRVKAGAQVRKLTKNCGKKS